MERRTGYVRAVGRSGTLHTGSCPPHKRALKGVCKIHNKSIDLVGMMVPSPIVPVLGWSIYIYGVSFSFSKTYNVQALHNGRLTTQL